MALRLNPLTGQYEEDGLPFDPSLPPPIEAPITEFNQVAPGTGAGGGGGGAPPGLPAGTPYIQYGPATKPLREEETAQKLKAPETSQAEVDLKAAETATDAASTALGEIEGKEADIQWEHGQQVADTKRAMLSQAQTDEEHRRKRADDWLSQDRSLIEEEKKARIESGRAHESYWEGRPAAKFLTRVLLAVGSGANIMRGGTGAIEAEQWLDKQIAQHQHKLVGKWEATKEANALKRQNRGAYEAELERRKIAANNQNLLSLDLLENQTNAAIAGLSKEKQAAARALNEAQLNEKRKGLWLQNQEGYNRLQKITTNSYGEGAGGADGADTWLNKPLTSEESKAKFYGKVVTEAMDKVGDTVLSDETIKQLQSNVRQLQAQPKDIIRNWMIRKGMYPVPDDFFSGIKDPAQRETARQWMNASNARMRHESGGAIQSEENLSDMFRNLPTVGDTAEAQWNKRNELLDNGLAILPRKTEAKAIYDTGKKNLDRFKAKPAEEEQLRRLREIEQEIDTERPAIMNPPAPENQADPSTWTDEQLKFAYRWMRKQPKAGIDLQQFNKVTAELLLRRRSKGSK